MKGGERMGKNKAPSPDKVFSREEFSRIARERGWTVDKSRGKGGHWWFQKSGEHSFPVPEIIKTGLQAKIKKWLGI